MSSGKSTKALLGATMITVSAALFACTNPPAAQNAPVATPPKPERASSATETQSFKPGVITSLSKPGALVDGKIVFKGEVQTPTAQFLSLAPVKTKECVVTGVINAGGGLSGGFQLNGRWVNPVNATAPGSFKMTLTAPVVDNYLVVFGHNVAKDSKTNDVVIEQWGCSAP